MQIKFFAPLWGFTDRNFEGYCREVAEAGYDGMEMVPPEDPAGKEAAAAALQAHGLEMLAMHALVPLPDFDRHLEGYATRLEAIAANRPFLINAHTGRDWFTFDQNRQLIDAASRITEASGVPVVHETHRGRFAFCAAVTARFLEAIPSLRLAADFSHWCVVSESFLEDQGAQVDAAIERADHIHARIGFDQGAQVNDPRAPEWEEAVRIHLAWWDRIVERHRKEGSTMLPITTEFGPPPYTPVLPHSQEPVAQQWDLNLHMLDLLKTRYAGCCG